MSRRNNTPHNDILESELASLADGSLSADRRREIEDRLHESEAARESIAKQRTAIDLVRGIDVEAPVELRNTVHEMVEPRRRRTPAPLVAGVATAVAVAVLGLLLITGGEGPKLDDAAQLALAGPQSPAPKQSSTDSHWLTTSVGGVRFPYWEDDLGWKSYGMRGDTFEGRDAKTVYYRGATGRSVAYTIVNGTALKSDQGRSGVTNGIAYRVSERNGTRRIVWTRGGHTCILTARDVPTSKLKTLVD